MNNIIYGFLLTTMAGFSTMIGTLFIFKKWKNKDMVISASLCFAAGVMITVSITDLIPESVTLLQQQLYHIPSFLICAIFVVIGIIVSMIIDICLPTNLENSKGGLYRIGIFSMLAIILHNIPEGIATFMTANNNTALGLSLAIAIALHNIPEGISISIPIYYGTHSKKKSLLYTFISSISEPFGALLAYLFLSPYINDFTMAILFSMIAGIMLHIALYELIPASKQYKNKKNSAIAFICGTIVMIISHFVF